MGNARLTRSMSRKTCSPDNAAFEAVLDRLKNELLYARDWMNTTIDESTADSDAYIRCYNEARFKISLGAMSPMEHRKSPGLAI